MPFIFQAVTAAIREFRIVNSQVDGDQIIYKGDINIGMAVALVIGWSGIQILRQSVPVLVDARAVDTSELAAVVKRNPHARLAGDPKRYQITFLANELPAAKVRELEEAAAPDERVVVAGREVYAWHPQTIARSKLWSKLAGQGLGVTATSRNWTTVEALLELARAR